MQSNETRVINVSFILQWDKSQLPVLSNDIKWNSNNPKITRLNVYRWENYLLAAWVCITSYLTCHPTIWCARTLMMYLECSSYMHYFCVYLKLKSDSLIYTRLKTQSLIEHLRFLPNVFSFPLVTCIEYEFSIVQKRNVIKNWFVIVKFMM